MRRALVAAALLLILTTGTVTALTAWRNATTSPTHEHALHDLIVAEHYRVCGTWLTNDARLIWLARYRSTDMVLNGYFSHTTPLGKRVWDFMGKAAIGYHSAAEILAWNSYPDDTSPKAAYSAFMASDSHRAEIRSCTYTRLGVGDYKVGAKHMYAVIFIKP